MFGRRKRSSSHHQPLSTPAAHSAQSAASHAFLKNQPSASSLSSAAAATALRNRTPTPTSVESIQTKRMVQRMSSTQSQASPLTTRRSASVSGALRRSNSSSSMTARTFRDASPHRPSTSSGPVDVPPLPSLPAHYAPRTLPNRRAASIEPSVRSPPASPPRIYPRGMSMDRAREGSLATHSTAHNRVGSLGTVPEMDRPGSRSSVNFSYPRGTRPNSPTLAAERHPVSLGSALREEPSTDRMLVEQPISDKPVDTRNGAHSAELSEEGHVGELAGVAIGAAAAAAADVEKGGSRNDHGHAKAEQRGEILSATQRGDHYMDIGAPVAISSSGNERPSRNVLERWPSTVPEEKEPEESSTPPHARKVENRLSTISPHTDHSDALVTPQTSPASSRETKQQQEGHLRQSSSPGRSARFSRWLSVATAEDQVHQPPPRSVSPVKSAMKHPRGSSLSPDRKVGVVGRGGQPPSEISDGTSVASDEAPRVNNRKRSVKVSFDDEAEVVGVAASPPTSPEEYTPEISPPGKPKSRMSWLGVGKKIPNSSELVTGDDGFEEMLKPRPVLPSFGSVRGNRDCGLQGPPMLQFSDNESSSSSDDEARAQGLSFSKDHSIGRILPKAQPRETKQHHNLELLPVNGDSSVSHQKLPNMNGIAVGKRTSFSGAESDVPVPAIAVEPATPPVGSDRPSLDRQRSSLEQYRIPGGFPASNSDRHLRNTATPTKSHSGGSAMPKLDDADTEEESGGSVYSDAAEDFDGDGFGSINAIVDSRSIPRSSAPLETSSESRDTTPRPLDRTAVAESQTKDVMYEALDGGRSVTPTQNPPNCQTDEPTVSAMDHSGFDGSYPPLPMNSQARNPGVRNETIHSESAKQGGPMSVDGRTLSTLQNPRHSSTFAARKDKARPVSLGPAFQRAGGQGGSPVFPGSLRRTRSSDSDSSSSFKRASASLSTRGDAPHPMHQTMRDGRTHQSAPASSESPTEYRPMSSGSSAGTMRKTLRGPGAGTERYSFFSTNKRAPRNRFAKPPPKSGPSSRFVDSDEEDGGSRMQTFQSRFVDSSDDDEPGGNTLRPVRGIPRRQGARDGDSTELEDSSEEDGQPRHQTAVLSQADPTHPVSRDRNAASSMSGMAAVARQRGMTQRELEEWLMQPPRGRRPSLLTRLGLKKPKNTDHRVCMADLESPSRRDTPLERSRLEREQLREPVLANGTQGTMPTSVTATRSEPPSSPKLQKKGPKRHTTGGGESWPLRTDLRADTPEPVVEQSRSLPSSPLRAQKPVSPTDTPQRNGSVVVNEDGQKPSESPGNIQSPPAARAGPILNDNASDDSNPEGLRPTARDVIISGSGRKKRFPLLRKAFGLRG